MGTVFHLLNITDVTINTVYRQPKVVLEIEIIRLTISNGLLILKIGASNNSQVGVGQTYACLDLPIFDRTNINSKWKRTFLS